MTHIEVKEEFEKRISEAKDKILSSRHKDSLCARISQYYINDKLVESPTYDGKCETSIVSSLMIFINGADGEDDAAYEISLLCDLKDGLVKDYEALQQEFSDFDSELERFAALLESTDNPEELIAEENRRIDEEGKKILGELEASVARLKKIGFAIAAILLVFLLLSIMIK